MDSLDLIVMAARALFVLGGAALLLAAFIPPRRSLRLGVRAGAALLILGGIALYFSSLPVAHWPLILQGLSLALGHHMVRRTQRLGLSREVLLPCLAVAFYAPLLGLLAWLAAEAAVKARWRAANA